MEQIAATRAADRAPRGARPIDPRQLLLCARVCSVGQKSRSRRQRTAGRGDPVGQRQRFPN